MKKIFCLGRPLLDITAFVDQKDFEQLKQSAEQMEREKVLSIVKKQLELKQFAKDYFISLGGVEFNVAINSAVLGLKSVFAGCVGNDEVRILLKEYVEIKNLELVLQTTNSCASGTIAVVLNKDLPEERLKILCYGASDLFKWNDKVAQALSSSDIFFTSLFSGNSLNLCEIWGKSIKTSKELNKKIVINMGGLNTLGEKEQKEALLLVNKNANIIVMNKEEEECALNIYQSRNIRDVLPCVDLLIITCAEQPVRIYTSSAFAKVKPPSYSGTTMLPFSMGTGDAFIAGFLYMLDHCNNNLIKAAEFGCQIAKNLLKTPYSHLRPFQPQISRRYL